MENVRQTQFVQKSTCADTGAYNWWVKEEQHSNNITLAQQMV